MTHAHAGSFYVLEARKEIDNPDQVRPPPGPRLARARAATPRGAGTARPTARPRRRPEPPLSRMRIACSRIRPFRFESVYDARSPCACVRCTQRLTEGIRGKLATVAEPEPPNAVSLRSHSVSLSESVRSG